MLRLPPDIITIVFGLLPTDERTCLLTDRHEFSDALVQLSNAVIASMPPGAIQSLFYSLCIIGGIQQLEVLISTGAAGLHDARFENCRSLCSAAMYGHTRIVQLLLGLGLTRENVQTCAALRLACANGYAEVVQHLLATGITADDVRANKCLALQFACEKGNVGIVKSLLALGLTVKDIKKATSPRSLGIVWVIVHPELVTLLRDLGMRNEDFVIV